MKVSGKILSKNFFDTHPLLNIAEWNEFTLVKDRNDMAVTLGTMLNIEDNIFHLWMLPGRSDQTLIWLRVHNLENFVVFPA